MNSTGSSSIASASTPSFIFRPAKIEDAEVVSTFICRVWSKHFAYSVSKRDLEDFLSTSLSPSQIALDISNPSMRFICATTPIPNPSQAPFDTNRSADRVAGIAQLVVDTSEPCLTLPDPVELRRLYVEDEYHGTGLAQALVREAEEIARRQGGKSLWLGVWEHNARGIRFYEKMGFKRCGEHSFLAGSSVRRDWVMEKPL